MYKKNHHSSQHGMATMAITLILLFIGTLVALYTAKTSIKEQQISANQYRADQSLSTANAALDWGVAYYTEARGFACDERLVGVLANYFATCPPAAVDDKATVCTIKSDDDQRCWFTYSETSPLYIAPDVTEDTYHKKDLSIGSSEMYFAFVETDEDCNDDGDYDDECPYIPVNGGAGESHIYEKEIRIYGVGHSDDDSAKRTVSVDVDTFNIFGDPGLGGSSFPLITKSTDAGSSVSVVNRFDNRTVWSGNEFTVGSAGFKTYILEPKLGWNCNDITRHDDCVQIDKNSGALDDVMLASDKEFSVNADIIDGDPNLDNYDNGDDFFKNIFGRTKEDTRDLAKDMGHLFTAVDKNSLIDTEGKTITWEDATLENDLANKTPLVWIDASGLPEGVAYAPSGKSQLGTEADPMVLIVDGDVNINGVGNTGIVLVGLLYITGTWDASANLIIQGMVVVETESDLQGGGTPTLIYDGNLFSGKIGPSPGTVAATVPATWHDWK